MNTPHPKITTDTDRQSETVSSGKTAADTPHSDANTISWSAIRTMAGLHRTRLIKANLIAILATICSVPVPLLLPVLVDEVLLGENGPVIPAINRFFPQNWHTPVLYILVMVAVALVLRLASLAFNVWQSKQFIILSKDIVFQIRRRMLDKLGRIAMSRYEVMGSGAMNAHFVTDLDTIDQFIGVTVSRFLVALLMIIGTACILLWMNWKLALIILVFNPLVIYLTTLIGKTVKELKRRENLSYELFQEALTETLEAIHQIRAANREQHYLSRLLGRAKDVRDNAVQFSWRSDAANRFSFMLFQFGVDVFRAAAMITVLFSDLSIGYMFAIFGYLWFMMGPVQEILAMQFSFYAANASLKRINQVLQLEQEPTYASRLNPFVSRTPVAIDIDRICFSYLSGQEILKEVSLNIAPGEKVALVGASGGGKSTLVQVILGMYTPQQGEIRFNGVPVQKIGLNVVRENVATVLQHPALFNDSIRANLTMGREYSDQACWQALEIAQLKETVSAMDEGLDTIVGRQGIRLSGGQRQRIAIARMVLSNPAVVILDEATSALDAETEYHVHAALESFLAGRTTIIVAHRLSAVKQADRVFVFEDGGISEQGQHEELLALKGLYYQLYGERQR